MVHSRINWTYTSRITLTKHTVSTKTSGTCSLGKKIDMTVYFAVFYAHIPPTVHLLLDILTYPFNICNCCSDPCFEFNQCIHSLAVHLSFIQSQRKRVQRCEIWRRGPCNWSSSSSTSTCEVHIQRVVKNVSKITGTLSS
jgi:hypothetical protein